MDPGIAARLTRVLAIGSCLLLIACSSSQQAPPSPREINAALAEVSGQDGRACMRLHDISGYAALGDSLVSVSNKFRKHFLLVTTYRCPALEMSTRALFKGTMTEFCGGGRDFLYSGQERCPIISIYEFPSRDEAFAAHDAAEARVSSQRASSGD